eukprot:gene9005-16647_t
MQRERNGLFLGDASHKSVNSDQPQSFFRRKILPFLHKYFPITKWLPEYRLRHLISDFIAGTTVGLMVIPQALAYASLAGLQNQYGLYSSFMGCFIYCLLGTSKDLTIGPTAILSLMVNLYGNPQNPPYTVTFTFYIGVILLSMGLLRLGFLVKMISTPVISAFTSAAAIVIATSQVKDILGLHEIPRDFFWSIVVMAKKITLVKPWDILFGVSCMLILILLKLLLKLNFIKNSSTDDTSVCKLVIKKILWFFGTARNAIVVFISIMIGYTLCKENFEDALTLSDDIDFGLPPFEKPYFTIKEGNKTISAADMLGKYGSGLVVVPLIAFLESIAIGKAFSRINGYKIIPTQELIALGVANIMSSFVSSFPVTGSFSRTAVNSQSGVQTPAAGIFTGTVVILAIKYLTPAFQYIPRACLGSIIILAVLPMVDYKIVKKIWTIKKLDILPLACTFVACFYSLEIGLLIGIGISLIIILYPLVFPRIDLDEKEITVLKVNNGIAFCGAEHLTESIENLVKSPEKPIMILLDFSGVTEMDFTVINELAAIFLETKFAGIEIYVSNLRLNVRQLFFQAELQDFIARTSLEIDNERASLI